MFTGGTTDFVLSPSDLTSAASCEFGWLRVADRKLGLLSDPLPDDGDAMLERTAVLGDAHEQRHLARLIEQHGSDGVVQIYRPSPYDTTGLELARVATVEALRDEVPVVFQAAFHDGGFGGLADFIVLGDDGTYEVWDAKLARHAKVPALLQIAAYANQLDREGIPRSPTGYLLLGDGFPFAQDLSEVIPVYRERRAKLEAMLHEHVAEQREVAWNDPRYTFCARCASCQAEIDAARDLMLVAGLRKPQRHKLRAAGIETIEQLADSAGHVDTMNPTTLSSLRAQAALQLTPAFGDGAREVPAFEVLEGGRAIHKLPAPSAGDVFFDFEGDPLWSDASGTDWGLEYLFGIIEPDGAGVFRTWWAHDRVQEKDALVGFLDYVRERRLRHPDMHVYHYAAYEVTALKRLVGRFGTHEDALDELLRAGVFVDLYQSVRQGVRVGTDSYSIKRLEPLYMGAALRTGLDNAADSIVEYQRYTDQLLAGDPAADATLAGIAEYNRYDCVSTWRLRDWLLSQVDDGTEAAVAGQDDDAGRDVGGDSIDMIAPVMEALFAHVGEHGKRTDDEQAAAMVAATLGYHRREHKPFWWAYFDRLTAWPGEWLEPRDCLHAVRVELVDDWQQLGRKLPARTLRLVGRLEPGTNLTPGTTVKGIYDDVPPGFTAPEAGGRCVGGPATIEDVDTTPDGLDVLLVRERTSKGIDTWSELPMGLCIPSPVPTTSIEKTLIELGTSISERLPAWPLSAGTDILRRVPPRFVSGGITPIGVSTEDAIHDSVVRLDHSYLAVQGPPGTGKTYVGSRVITRLVAGGWRVGVVAQSHAVVENFMTAAVEAGLSPDLMAKPRNTQERPWADLNSAKLMEFIDDHATTGCLVGGTAWTFAGRGNVGSEQLDLLVIDEAGQFSLATTLAVSTAASSLLLLGDPQQLPQVSQGSHPEPVEVSALEWVADGHETLPDDRGYFLERTWRMHSKLTASVSRLSYAGRLRSQEAITDARMLSGIEPGIHVVTIEHRGNEVQSPEEAAAVVDLVRGMQQQTWRAAPDDPVRPMTPSDVLVVAPYNAQGALVRHELDAAGFDDTRVGTVDKFQGQEAPVVIVSMTTSSADEVPRGMEFLLNRNRLNVAISRGQWAAYVVRSVGLTDFLPTAPGGLAELGAFIQLGGGHSSRR